MVTPVPIVSGIYTDNGPDIRTAYPVNMMPVPRGSGMSEYYLRPHDGITQLGTGPGIDRGGIEWQGVCYRVMGTSLVSVAANGTVTTLGSVGGSGYVTMDYSFDLLGIASGGNLFFWDPAAGTLTQNTDPDLGLVNDLLWIDGYWMTTDGTNLVVTEIGDPLSVNPLKYGSAEADPDPVVAGLRLRNEVYAVNRHTIEVLDNVGGEFFPFARIDGAQVQKGAVGTHAVCVFDEQLAFVGSGRNEANSIYVASNATATQIATAEIDTLLSEYSEDELEAVKVEYRLYRAHKLLYVHLPNKTLVYDHTSSEALQQRVWFVLTSTVDGFEQYRAQNMVYCYGKWIVGDPQDSRIGYFNNEIGHHWGSIVRWEFSTPIFYNNGMGGIFHEIELVALTGRVELGTNPQISTSYSIDGQSWSQDKYISVGTTGNALKRLVWWQQGFMKHWRIQRVRGNSSAHISVSNFNARLEPLAA